ncbi:hypothetical protein PUNSTDRAFT_144689 [Punctularia strigosozonata HHB-11173 SS5]|uniref:uncharacterized protein n=1 Tax=Punctularia strigosozonata (strain HHB-11173) TaxID=741275 RepID=UPI0004417A31|nr:uncharacterized protein PUNSTDRAFT_144689 [Punctularia strigosozonata HHB-11173 SS5]EIN07151.1 hypothetical protein PUNSTDRAFT_144689 [Punctularia strigosozonata HHB-11173 SS5]
MRPSLWFALLGACTTASAAPRRRLARRDSYLGWYIQADTPTSTTSGETFQVQSNGKWYDIASNQLGIELEGDGPSLAYRLKGYNHSDVLLSVNTSAAPLVWFSDAPEVDVDVYANIHTTYNASVTSENAGKTKTIPVTGQSFSVTNVECDDSINITGIVTYANGTSVTSDAVDNWGTGVSDSVTTIKIVANGPAVGDESYNNSVINFTFNGSGLYTAEYGEGPGLPTVTATHDIEVQFCPD